MSISIIFARAVLSEVRSRGLDHGEVLRRSSIEAERLTDLRATLSFEESDLLTRNAMVMTADPGLGLSMGANEPKSMLQVFGHLMLAQGSIREAFTVLRKYAALLVEGVAWDLSEHGGQAVFTVEPGWRLGASTRCAMECALAMTLRIGQHFSPRDAAPIEVHFQHREPSYAPRYAAVFDCPVRFGQPTNALVFPREYVDLQQLHADDTVHTVLRDTAERLLLERAQSRSLVERVRTHLRYERDLAELDVERLARQVGLSGRALRRKLGLEGTHLSRLVDEARCRVACDELRRPDRTIKETAALLGFSETSAFHRAFKRWTGHTPGEHKYTTD